MRLIDADELKSKKEYSEERHEWIVPVAAIDWVRTVEAAPVAHGHWESFTTSAFIRMDEAGEPKWADRRFFVHKECGRGPDTREESQND